jgi:hypothetical protein
MNLRQFLGFDERPTPPEPVPNEQQLHYKIAMELGSKPTPEKVLGLLESIYRVTLIRPLTPGEQKNADYLEEIGLKIGVTQEDMNERKVGVYRT